MTRARVGTGRRTLRRALTLAVACGLAHCQLTAPARGQSAELRRAATQLLVPAQHDGALRVLMRGGTAAAHLVATTLAGLAPDDARAALVAADLARLGTATAADLELLAAEIERRDDATRCHLLRAIANGALLADERAHAAVQTAAATWASRGWLYSDAADHPTFAWYEYVRMQRRLQLARRGTAPADLRQELVELAAARSMFWGGQPMDVHAIEAHGAHGQRELLEAVADLVLATAEGGPTRGAGAPPLDATDAQMLAAVAEELRRYLAASPPRPPVVRTESQAGFGENAPALLPGAMWPTLWRYDAWHFACARAVLACKPEPAARTLALRHLLHADDPELQIDALEQVRAAPPTAEFAPELAACLAAADRRVVREALVAIGIAPAVLLDATGRTRLAELAAGGDAELRGLAARLLTDRR